MYQVKCDGQLLYDPRVDDLHLFNPVVTLEVNKTGGFDFTIYPSHPLYNQIKRLKSSIEVYQDNFLLFRGRVLNDEHDFYNAKNIVCEGDLAFFNDSIIRPYNYSGTVIGFLQDIIDQHNAQVSVDKQFALGEVTVSDPNDYITRSSINADKSWNVINDKLIDLLGGYIMVRRENGTNYIDYLEDSTYRSLQKIELGENLLDLSKSIKGENIITALIPYGAKLKDDEGNETDERLTIEEVNGGKDYVYNQEAVDLYGWVFDTVIYEDVTVANNLLTKANAELATRINMDISIEVSAIDLSMTDTEIDQFRIFEYIEIDSPSHLLEDFMLTSKLVIHLDAPQNNKLTLGMDYATFTERQLQTEKAIKNVNTIKGPAGSDGQTYYTWVKYADDENGSGMSDSPDGKRYVGMAFNKTTATESNTSSAYNWSPLYDNVEVGGRNLILNSNSILLNGSDNGNRGLTTDEGTYYSIIPENNGNVYNTGIVPSTELVKGQEYTLSFEFFSNTNVTVYWYAVTGGGAGSGGSINNTQGEWVKHEFTYTQSRDTFGEAFLWGFSSLITGSEVGYRNLKLEKGNVATDWTPAPEDVQANIDEKADNDYVTEVVTTMDSNIEQTAEAIRTEVEENYTATSAFETYQQSVSTQFEQTKNSFNFTFEELTQQISTLDGETRAQFEEIVRYIRFVNGNIVLGEVGNEITLRIENDRISFLQSGSEVAYFSNNKLFITDAEVLNSLKIGEFAFIPRANGSLDFK